jgi:ferrous iron transport protein B
MCTKIALVGSPNTAKTSLFNLLTGMNQQVGNFPGVTVEKHWGKFNLPDGRVAELLDLPGAYSLNAYSEEEKIVSDILHDRNHEDFPELVVVTVDVTNLERNLVILTQISDLNIPVIGVLTMNDMLAGKPIDTNEMSKAFNGIPFLKINGRTGEGKRALIDFISACQIQPVEAFISFPLKKNLNLAEARRDAEARKSDIVRRLTQVPSFVRESRDTFTTKVDKILVHPIFGYGIFSLVLFLIFQFMFVISAIPMDWIDSIFLNFSQFLQGKLTEGIFTDLLTQGIVPGVGGVLVFVPQIAILFFFIGVLEETGYMTRVVFIMDRLVRPFGLNGRSVVPLVSSAACAIPAILSTRVIGNPKERLITILVSPLISCSAHSRFRVADLFGYSEHVCIRIHWCARHGLVRVVCAGCHWCLAGGHGHEQVHSFHRKEFLVVGNARIPLASLEEYSTSPKRKSSSFCLRCRENYFSDLHCPVGFRSLPEN